MWDHTVFVTCHPTQVNTARVALRQAGTRFICRIKPGGALLSFYFCSEVDADTAVYFEGKAVVEDATSIINFINNTAISRLANVTINGRSMNTDIMRHNLLDQGNNCTSLQ